MANVNVTIRLDEDVRKEADKLFDEMGMTLSTAVNIFIRQCLREQKIPFQVGLGSTSQNVEYHTVSLGGPSDGK